MKSQKMMNAWQTVAFATLLAGYFLFGADAPAFAQSFLQTACGKVNEVWTYAQHAIYIVGGIGICVCAVYAFIGRFRWSLLFAISGGVFLVATATQLFTWIAGQQGNC